jgi:hypothetical protein
MVQMIVSRIEAGFATLVTDDHHFLELPLYVFSPAFCAHCISFDRALSLHVVMTLCRATIARGAQATP